jgi:uncharacterized protein
LPFYRCYRAYVRGKVLSFRLNEAEFSEQERDMAAARAVKFFDLALRYASRLPRAAVIAVGGLSGTGKTAIARAIAGELGLRVVSSDATRRELFGDEKRPASYGEGVYTEEANRLTYQTILERGRELLDEDRGVVLDATWLSREERAMAEGMARGVGAEWRLIECRLAPETARKRMEERAARKDGLSDASWEVYLRQSERYAGICDISNGSGLAVDTGGDLSIVVRTATDWLRPLLTN